MYHGTKSSHSGAVITVETPGGEVLGVVRHIAVHSPGGMTWGYGGSGPLDCARSLLAAALGGDGNWGACGGAGVIWDFRDEVVAGLGDEWRMSRGEILPWLDGRRGLSRASAGVVPGSWAPASRTSPLAAGCGGGARHRPGVRSR